MSWLLAVMTAALCELGSVAALALRSLGSGLDLAAGYLLFAALVIGSLSLLLALAVYQLRRVPPPPGILTIGLAVGALPLVVSLLQMLFR